MSALRAGKRVHGDIAPRRRRGLIREGLREENARRPLWVAQEGFDTR
jgi:hypothetical protein